ncbi:serine/threonine-protein kinase TOR isoform X1 [Populus alba x Populus x berolinensis]|nr:serine/threonine-protein kinase TOR isoform X1 [Populus alba x Populus x berolinensis]
MASTSQSLRFLVGPTTTAPGGGSFDALNRILADLCTRGNPKEGATLALRKHLEEEARDISGEAFPRFMDHLYERISSLLESNEVAENLGALRATDELIDVALGENASKVSKFAIYMRSVFEVKRDPEVLTHASRVLGHLARAGGAMTADEVEFQVKMALDWLRNDKAEFRLFAAVLILKEVAENASTVFNVHVPEFVDAIWVALRHPTLAIRERAVEALRACLRVIEKRETRWRVQWYYRMFEATQDGLGKNAPVYSIHGSLLAVGELLSDYCPVLLLDSVGYELKTLHPISCYVTFTASQYKSSQQQYIRNCTEKLLRLFLDTSSIRDRLVRLSITSLLPRIAHFLRDRFVTNYLEICMNHILAVLRIPAERGSGFIALGEMAGALDGELEHYLPTITAHLRDAIAPRRAKPSLEALACVGNIAKAMKTAMEPYVRWPFGCHALCWLSPTLVEALEQISDSIPSLLPTIQERLLDCISLALSKSHFSQSRAAIHTVRGSNDERTSASIGPQWGMNFLSLPENQWLYIWMMKMELPGKMLHFVADKLVANSFSVMVSTQVGSGRSNRAGGKRWRLVEELVEKLLIAAVADADVTVRQSIFSSLHGNRGFDDFLAQADILSAVFAALNDEV